MQKLERVRTSKSGMLLWVKSRTRLTRMIHGTLLRDLRDKESLVANRFISIKGIPRVEDPRYKTRLVGKGYTQVEGVDFNEIFSPVVKHVSIRIIMSYVVNFDAELEQMDVKTAFLHVNLDETIYMEQPESFIKKGDEGKVCLPKKLLYGLKQSP